MDLLPLNTLSQNFFDDPYPTFEWLQSHAPVYWHPRLEAWLLTRHRDIQTALRSPCFSAERVEQMGKDAPSEVLERFVVFRRFLERWMLFRDGAPHTNQRRVLTGVLTPWIRRPQIESFLVQMTDTLVERLMRTPRFDFVEELAYPIPTMLLSRILGIPEEFRASFKQWTNDIFLLIGAGVATAEAVEAGYRGVCALQGLVRELITRRRQVPSDDLITELLGSGAQGALTDDEIAATCAMLVVAGHETTTSLLSNALLLLLRHPGQLSALRMEPTLMDGAIEASLCYESPVFSLIRRATEDVSLSGTTVRAGQHVFCMLGAGNRDPERFTAPHQFEIARDRTGHLSFGFGPHACIGTHMAKVVVRTVLLRLVSRPGLRLAFGGWRFAPNLSLRTVANLWITIDHGAALGQSSPTNAMQS
jgi:cytochrome P450